MNQKIDENIYKKLRLATLLAIILLITPLTAAAVTIPTNSTQTVLLHVPQCIGFSLSTNTLTFNVDNLGTTATTPTYNLTNIGNTNIDLSIQSNNDFTGPETITLTEGLYTLIYQNNNIPITKNSNTIFKTNLNPQRHGTSTIPLYQTFTVPYGVLSGTYNTTVTYTAIKSS